MVGSRTLIWIVSIIVIIVDFWVVFFCNVFYRSFLLLYQERKWATGLAAGESGLSVSSASVFHVRVELTDEGQERAMDVAAVIFQYIHLLRGPGGVAKEIFEELKVPPPPFPCRLPFTHSLLT
jgi:hypothetical protein